MNLARIAEALAAAYPDREAIVTPTRRVTYGALAERARRLASVLAAHGLGVRRERADLANHESGQDHVGLYMLNCARVHRGHARLLSRARRALQRELPLRRRRAALPARRRRRGRARLPRALRADAGRASASACRSSASSSRSTTARASRSCPGALDYEAALAAASPAGPSVVPLARRPLHPLHRRHDGRAEGRPLAAGGHLPRRDDRRRARAAGPDDASSSSSRRRRTGTYMRVHADPAAHARRGAVGRASARSTGRHVVLQGQPERLDPDDVWGTVERERVSFAHHRRRRLRAPAPRRARAAGRTTSRASSSSARAAPSSRRTTSRRSSSACRT